MLPKSNAMASCQQTHLFAAATVRAWKTTIAPVLMVMQVHHAQRLRAIQFLPLTLVLVIIEARVLAETLACANLVLLDQTAKQLLAMPPIHHFIIVALVVVLVPTRAHATLAILALNAPFPLATENLALILSFAPVEARAHYLINACVEIAQHHTAPLHALAKPSKTPQPAQVMAHVWVKIYVHAAPTMSVPLVPLLFAMDYQQQTQWFAMVKAPVLHQIHVNAPIPIEMKTAQLAYPPMLVPIAQKSAVKMLLSATAMVAVTHNLAVNASIHQYKDIGQVNFVRCARPIIMAVLARYTVMNK